MSDREKVCFKVYNTTTDTVSVGSRLPFDNIDFNTGGTYDTGKYEYTFLKDGTYLMGITYNKIDNNGVIRFFLNRSGTISGISASSRGNSSPSDTTVDTILLYNFIAGDILYTQVIIGTPEMNVNIPDTGDIYNSWWGIRLDWV